MEPLRTAYAAMQGAHEIEEQELVWPEGTVTALRRRGWAEVERNWDSSGRVAAAPVAAVLAAAAAEALMQGHNLQRRREVSMQESTIDIRTSKMTIRDSGMRNP
jgi:hypothetical protein